MFTGVLEPLTQGRDDSWPAPVTPVASGAVAARWDELALSLLLATGLPVLLVVAGVAIFVGRRWERVARRAAVAAYRPRDRRGGARRPRERRSRCAPELQRRLSEAL